MEEAPDKRVKQLPEDLKDIVPWFDGQEYGLVVKHSATVVRRKTLETVGLGESRTNDEMMRALSELGYASNMDMMRYILNLGERCAYAGYGPTKEEAEKVIEYSIKVLSDLSPA
jgi:hypothetical protein